MRIVLFCHSLLSDWNHGNAHFLRGLVVEWCRRGHAVTVYEPRDAWSVQNLRQTAGSAPVRRLRRVYPELRCRRYRPDAFDLDAALDGADLVLVHEWTDPALVRRVGRHRARAPRPAYRLFFHDTHHRAVTAPEQMAAYDLADYDGVLAFGRVIRDLYLDRGWAAAAWTWHEAADARLCGLPRPGTDPADAGGKAAAAAAGAREDREDLVWIGNWGDEERSAELREYLVEPAAALGLRGTVYGVRYPPAALEALTAAGLRYGGWLPNFEAPARYAAFRVTVHVPRRPYARALPGIPTIRVFEALACGIPLVSAPWEDAEGLFAPGEDFLCARDGAGMRAHLRAVLADPDLAAGLARRGRQTVAARHTCAHRVDELFAILDDLDGRPPAARPDPARREAAAAASSRSSPRTLSP